jgi:outer membrane autotransporter protein
VLELQSGFTIVGNVVGTGVDRLRLGGSAPSTFDISAVGAQYQGFGTFEKTGTSNWTLTGTSTFAGPIVVNAGTLSVNGSIASSVLTTVNGGGTLGGHGIVGATLINGGTLAPGNSIGTITVNGNLTFNAGSTYAVEVSPATADRTAVSGTTTLAGTVNAQFAPGAYTTKMYTILSAAGGLGGSTFDTLTTTGLPTNFQAGLSYTGTDVLLNLTAALGFGAPFDINQWNVAGAINGFFNNGGTLPPDFATLFGLTGEPLGNALTQISGELGADTLQTSFDAMNMFLNALLDPFNDGHLGALVVPGTIGNMLGYAGAAHDNAAAQGYAAVTPKDRRPVNGVSFARRWNVWASGYGGSGSVSGDATTGSHDTTDHIYGMAAGADYRVSPDTLIGFALGGAGFNFDMSDGLGGGRADLFQAGVYARHWFGPAYVAGALAYGWQDVKTNRTVTISGTDDLEAEFHAQTFAARLEGGYRFATPWLGVTPYAALQATSFHQPSYAESATSGSSTFALSYNSQTTTNWRTELGVRFDQSFGVTGGLLTLRSRIAWAHDSDTDRAVTAAFQALPGAAFTVNGAAPAADSALVSAGAEMRWANGFSLAASFEGEFSDTTQSYAGKGTLRYVW